MSDKKADAAFIKEKALVNEVGDIVARLQAGEDVFQDFYEKTKRYVYYIAISNGVTQNDAEDVVQDTFVHFFKKYKEIENPSSAMSWLKRSAFGHSIDCLKKKKDVCLAKDEDTEFDAFDTDALIQPLAIPETALEEKERAGIISEIVDSLPEDQKKCVRAFYFDECKIKDIANAYGVPENTVKTNLYRGRKNIEAKLVAFSKKHGIKIVSVAVVPFFSLLFSEEAEAYSVPLPYSAVAQATGTGVVAKVGIGAALKTGREIATKEIATKVAIAVISVGVIGGGIVAGMTYANAEQARVEQKSEQLKKEEESKPVETVTSNEITSQSAEGSREAEPNRVVRPTTPNIVAENREVAAPMSLAEELPSLQAEVEEDDDWESDYSDSDVYSHASGNGNESSGGTESVKGNASGSGANSGNASGSGTNNGNNSNNNAVEVAADGSVTLSNGSGANYSGGILTINSAGTSALGLPIELKTIDGNVESIDSVSNIKITSGAVTVNTPNDSWSRVINWMGAFTPGYDDGMSSIIEPRPVNVFTSDAVVKTGDVSVKVETWDNAGLNYRPFVMGVTIDTNNNVSANNIKTLKDMMASLDDRINIHFGGFEYNTTNDSLYYNGTEIIAHYSNGNPTLTVDEENKRLEIDFGNNTKNYINPNGTLT